MNNTHVQAKNCPKANQKSKISVLLGIFLGFTTLIGILEMLATPSALLVPIALFLGFVSLISAFLLFNSEKNK
jgi:cadmium resistance protein CadD (predicted permease)